MIQKVDESQGLSYFPLECERDAEFNKALQLITAEFGMQAYGIVILLLQKIYGEQGYYCECNKDVLTLLSQAHGVVRPKKGDSVSLINEIVICCVRRGVFSKQQYEKNHILTSEKIQENFLRATKRRKVVKMKKAYLLVKVALFSENVVILGENEGFDVNIFGQSIKDKNIYSLSMAPPEIEEIVIYAKQNHIVTNVSRFYAYYSKNGWKNKNGVPVTDWKAALWYWSSYDAEYNKAGIPERGKAPAKRSKNQFTKLKERSVSKEELDDLEQKLLQK